MPAFNEINTIAKIIERVRAVKIPKEIIIVDDGSTDGTKEYLTKLKKQNIPKIKIFFHNKNYGKGHAIRTGIKHAEGKIIIIQDTDLELNPKEYYKLIKPIQDKKTRVVYGSRFLVRDKKPSIFNKYYFGNRIVTMLSNFLYDAKITDEPICYKVFDADILKSLNLKCEGFEFCPEVTAKIRKKGYKIYEIPVSYNPRSVKEGKKLTWQDGVKAISTLIKYRFID